MKGKLTLRRLVSGDAARVHELLAEDSVRATTNLPAELSPHAAGRWVDGELARAAAGTGFAVAIIEREELVGVVVVGDVGGQPIKGDLGYFVGKPFWGRGLATEAVGRVAATAFEELRLETLEACCLARHEASRRVLEKNGFRLVRLGPPGHPKWGPDDLFAYYRLESGGPAATSRATRDDPGCQAPGARTSSKS
jgi:RimJ/RimL family protein N-acetyltransferase